MNFVDYTQYHPQASVWSASPVFQVVWLFGTSTTCWQCAIIRMLTRENILCSWTRNARSRPGRPSCLYGHFLKETFLPHRRHARIQQRCRDIAECSVLSAPSSRDSFGQETLSKKDGHRAAPYLFWETTILSLVQSAECVISPMSPLGPKSLVEGRQVQVKRIEKARRRWIGDIARS